MWRGSGRWPSKNSICRVPYAHTTTTTITTTSTEYIITISGIVLPLLLLLWEEEEWKVFVSFENTPLVCK